MRQTQTLNKGQKYNCVEGVENEKESVMDPQTIVAFQRGRVNQTGGDHCDEQRAI